jgi:two-component system sensor histidine kinase BarA
VTPPTSASRPAGRRPLPTVLLVEDDTDMQQLVRLALRHRCEVLLASTAAEARAQLAAHAREVRMILLDLTLVGPEGGLALTRELRSTVPWRRIPIVAETAHVRPEDRAAALRAGCNEFLPKPFYPKELRSIVDHYLAQPSED